MCSGMSRRGSPASTLVWEALEAQCVAYVLGRACVTRHTSFRVLVEGRPCPVALVYPCIMGRQMHPGWVRGTVKRLCIRLLTSHGLPTDVQSYARRVCGCCLSQCSTFMLAVRTACEGSRHGCAALAPFELCPL